MYDKVKLWMPRMSTTPDITPYLDKYETKPHRKTGLDYTTGNVGTLKVNVYAGGISVIGSLPRYLNGSNIYPLDRHTSAQAIEKLSDALHLDMSEAKVTGLEFGTIFPMRKPVDGYLRKLGDMPRLIRYHFGVGTLYYKPRGKQQSKVFCFYDKLADAKNKGIAIPKGLEDSNLLKYEMRLNSRLAAQLGVPLVEATTLSDANFYRKVMQKWQASYLSISRKQQIKLYNMSEIKTVSDAFYAFIAQLINQSDSSQISTFLEELKAYKVFDDRKCYTRLKNKILDVGKKATTNLPDEDIRELDEGIKNAGAYL